eukprot:5864709-Pyramimonas_sp.AAC.1
MSTLFPFKGAPKPPTPALPWAFKEGRGSGERVGTGRGVRVMAARGARWLWGQYCPPEGPK